MSDPREDDSNTPEPNSVAIEREAVKIWSTANVARSAVFVVVAIAIGLFFSFHLERYFTLNSIHDSEIYLDQNFSLQSKLLIFFVGAVTWVVCALPAATIIMLLAGALFGPQLGTVVCMLATSTGAVLSLLTSRFLFRDFVRRRFKRPVAAVERAYARSGSQVLIAMRLIPVVPYFVTNLLFGLTPIPPLRFWLTSMMASLPAIFIYANAGAELSKVTALENILTWRLIAALVALAALPFLGRFVTKKVLKIREPLASDDTAGPS